MNHNRLRRQCSITAERRPVAVLVQAGVAVGTQCRRTDCDVPNGLCAVNATTASDRSNFREQKSNAMATSVAMLERYQQPTAVVASANSPMVTDIDRSFHGQRHRHHHQVQHDDYPRSHRAKYNSVSAGSALSKSMRYADGWLYERDAGGTVGHGRGGRNKARSTFFGREHFGVPAASATAATTVSTAATATTPPQPPLVDDDPYDRVRKNRMSGMSTTTTTIPAATLTGKMDRKRNRSNGSSRTPSPDYDDSGGYGNVSSPSRRSILECNVNPYDLVLRQPSDCDENDDDDENNCPKRMSLKDKFMNRIQDTVFTKNNRTSCNGVGSRFGSFSSNGSAKKTTADRNNGLGVNIAGHTVNGIFYIKVKFL